MSLSYPTASCLNASTTGSLAVAVSSRQCFAGALSLSASSTSRAQRKTDQLAALALSSNQSVLIRLWPFRNESRVGPKQAKSGRHDWTRSIAKRWTGLWPSKTHSMTWFGGVLPCTVPEDSSLRTRHKNTKTKTMKQLAVFAAFALASSSLAALSGVAEVPRGPP